MWGVIAVGSCNQACQNSSCSVATLAGGSRCPGCWPCCCHGCFCCWGQACQQQQLLVVVLQGLLLSLLLQLLLLLLLLQCCLLPGCGVLLVGPLCSLLGQLRCTVVQLAAAATDRAAKAARTLQGRSCCGLQLKHLLLLLLAESRAILSSL
jgi:hypothetical protein